MAVIVAVTDAFYHRGVTGSDRAVSTPFTPRQESPWLSLTSNDERLKPDGVVTTAGKFQDRPVVVVTAQFLAGQKQ
ncbi:hypothetical protein [Methylocaldum szegediense]|jgi:hypothetical protein|uniref:Uncharacterized protein n=1 Tax=Methylocaldum szegediense TaxID=73780 RepID=A0ABM9I6S7_9GAMM|nr:hypothetical protein [Methylocaldum szegediense]CAI8928064.1 protein of unknown function [Methylocaldum szegediense]